MRNALGTIMIAGVAALFVGGVTESNAAEASVGVDVASAYVFRGGTLNDSFVAQPYAEVGGEGLGGFTFGTWANFDLDDNEGGSPESGHFSEIDLYASYAVPMDSDAVALSIGYTEYAYPRAGGSIVTNAGAVEVEAVDADRELNVVAEFDAPLAPSLGVYFGVDGGIQDDIYVELGLGHEVELSDDSSLSLGATVAYLDDNDGESGISYASLSAGMGFGPVSVGVTYIIETDDDVVAVDEELVGTIGVGRDF